MAASLTSVLAHPPPRESLPQKFCMTMVSLTLCQSGPTSSRLWLAAPSRLDRGSWTMFWSSWTHHTRGREIVVRRRGGQQCSNKGNISISADFSSKDGTLLLGKERNEISSVASSMACLATQSREKEVARITSCCVTTGTQQESIGVINIVSNWLCTQGHQGNLAYTIKKRQLKILWKWKGILDKNKMTQLGAKCCWSPSSAYIASSGRG